MLILAGVSLNAIIGDNGIITNAQNATILQSCAVLEEFLNEEYTSLYEDNDMYENAIDLMLYSNSTSKYFQKAFNNANYFLNSDTYKEYYFIEKSELPEYIRNQLKGGENSLTGKTMYADFNDIYGVTFDLKVYYCQSESVRFGAEDNARETNLNKVIANSGSDWSNVLGMGDITLSNIKAQNGNITINKNGLDLNFLSNFGNAKSLTFDGVTYDNLIGIEKMPKLNKIIFKNCDITDYSALGGLSNKLVELYIRESNDDELSKIFSKDITGIGNYDFEKLEKIAITSCDSRYYWTTNSEGLGDNINVTTISSLSNLSDKTKLAVEYLNIDGNYISSIEVLKNFKNLYFLKAKSNEITTLKSLSGLNNLTYIIVSGNLLGKGLESNAGLQENTDALSCAGKIKDTGANNITNYVFESTLPSLYYLDIRNNEDLIWINYLKGNSSLKYLYTSGCTNLDSSGITMMKIAKDNNVYKELDYDTKFALSFLKADTQTLNLLSQNVDIEVFKTLSNYTNLNSLNLNDVTITENGEAIASSEHEELINTTLSSLVNLKALGIKGFSGLTTLRFLENMPNMTNIDLRGTGVKTYEGDTSKNGLELLNSKLSMYHLAINNEDIDLSYIQPTINRLGIEKKNEDGTYPEGTVASMQIDGYSSCKGLFCGNQTSLKTLEKCTQITGLRSNLQTLGGIIPCYLNLENCTNLICWETTYWYGGVIIKLPSSLISFSIGPEDYNKYDLSLCSNLTSIAFSRAIQVKQTINTIKNYDCITYISVADSNLNEFLYSFDTVKNFTNLRTLSIKQVHWLQDKSEIASLSAFEKLSKLQNLKTLTMNLIKVKDNDWSYLQYLPNIEYLTITKSNISDISGLNMMLNLKQVDLSNSSVINGLQALKGKSQLQQLNLNYCPIEDISEFNGKNYNVVEILISLHPNNGGPLKKLSFAGVNISEDNLVELKKYNWNIL